MNQGATAAAKDKGSSSSDWVTDGYKLYLLTLHVIRSSHSAQFSRTLPALCIVGNKLFTYDTPTIVIDPQSPIFQGRYRETHLGKLKIMSILEIFEKFIFANGGVLIWTVFI